MGEDFKLLKRHLRVWYAEERDGFIVIQGAMPHSFTIAEAYLALSLDNSDIYVALLVPDYAPVTKESITYIKAYKPSYDSPLPASMKAWLLGKPSDVRWNTMQ